MFSASAPRSPTRIFMAALGLVGLIGAADLMTGHEVSLSVIYGLPIFLVAWKTGRNLGILMALLCALVWWWASVAGRLHILNSWLQVWEVFARIALFVFISLGTAALRRARDATAARIAALEQARRLEAEIIGISEREQRRIGRDLHDGLCQYQAALACAATALEGDLIKKSLPVEAKVAGDLARFLREAIGQTRDLARGLVPVPLEEAGLPSALEELARSVSRLQAIDCRFEMQGDPRAFDDAAATNLYRISQEAISNATRHGGARNIVLSLIQDGVETRLRVVDDGVGLSRAQPTKAGMGLSIMKYRAKMAGGHLDIEEPESGGTAITCLIPCPEEAHDHERAA